jgi:uncharacterized membrane protein YhaH (DUF805 family)
MMRLQGGQTVILLKEANAMSLLQIEPLIAAAVVVATALTDAVYVLFTNAVVRRHRLPAATWSSVWYLLSSVAVISYTNDWVYVLFAAVGSFIGAYATMTYLHPGPTYPPPPVGSAPC